MTTVRPLNFMNYNKFLALKELKDKIGYKDYGRKHGESRFTKFFQNYYLPTKFNIDKRRAHLSSMILTGLISREEALSSLAEPLYEAKELREDKIYIAKKLGISVEELDSLIESKGKSYKEYKNWDALYFFVAKLKIFLTKVTCKNVKSYS